MGKFPSAIWHNNDIGASLKKSKSSSFVDVVSRTRFMVEELGVPHTCFEKPKEDDNARQTSSEIIPLRFMAQQIVDFVRSKIVEPNRGKYSEEVLKVIVIPKKIVNIVIK